jgi:phospholipase C
MTALNRRRFLQVAGGATAMTVLSPSIARAASVPANRRTGSLRDVEHIVVFMQENRSFDHYFGALRGVRGFGDPRPVVLPSGKPVWHQSDGTRDVLPFRPQIKDLGLQFIQDLAHGWNDGHDAWNGGRYDRWVPAKTATTMAYLTREDIPFHYALADAFTICDAYHCSFLGATDPNRYYMWTGFTGNDGKGGGPVLGNDEVGYDWTTYPERLEKAGVSWKIYQDRGTGLDAAGSWGWTPDAFIGNYGDNSLLYFHQYQNAAPGNPLYDKARTGTDARGGEDFFHLLKADVLSGNLPQVSWIVAPEAFTEHPNWPANFGAWYVAQVLDALTADPEVWSRTALLLTYDENDGFFDHVVPPYPAPSATPGRSTVDTSLDLFHPSGTDTHVAGPYGLGVRVPMIVVSPWSSGGWVCSQTFDHTSIIQLIERRFGVHEPNISPWRRAVCGDLTAAFDFGRTVTARPALPDTAGYLPPDHDRHPDYVPPVPANPALPKQERGLRPARPLPYDLAVDGRVAGGRLRIDFANHGDAGANFYVTSATHPDGPWSYTVGAERQLSGVWELGSTDRYDFSAFGPNGFLRRLAGHTGTTGVEVTVHDGEDGEIEFVLSNTGQHTVRLSVSNAYGPRHPATYRLLPGGRVTHRVELRHSHFWYDVSVTGDHDATYLRRLAGHVETGRPSTSDPGIMTT